MILSCWKRGISPIATKVKKLLPDAYGANTSDNTRFIVYYDYKTKKIKKILDKVYFSFDVSPDERYILFSRFKDPYSDIDIIENMWE